MVTLLNSCVHTIHETLKSLSPPPTDIQVSIVSQSVTIHHSKDLYPQAIKDALEDAGFDIPSTPIAGSSRYPDELLSPASFLTGKRRKHVDQCSMCQHQVEGHRDNIGEEDYFPGHFIFSDNPSTEKPQAASDRGEGQYQLILSVGGMTCASCTGTITQALSELPGVTNVVVSLLSNSATATLDRKGLAEKVVEVVEDIGYEADIASLEGIRAQEPAKVEGPYHLSLSVGGMTCASCSSTITRLVSELQDVSDVTVSLLGNSASVDIQRKELAAKIVEVIEDAGYEATVISITPVKATPNGEANEDTAFRTVSLQVEGMFCQHCPEKVMAALQQFGSEVVVEKPLTDRQDPILRLTYRPSPPLFSIRTIIDAISSTKSPPFNVSIYKSPSIEERARYMQYRERRHLLFQLVFSVIVAIPTFIIGIVYMSLVPNGFNGRLFFLATPVMFYSAGTFHRRSLKEIRALWRRGSRTPIWKRFVRFGSMNLLVSSGVSVAYFASIALLALAASTSPSPDGHGDNTTYFDSVVLLTMFLLFGRYLEAYSKSHTADAITSLGKLRPVEADLLVPHSATDPPERFRDSDDDIEKGSPASESVISIAKPGFKVQRMGVELLEVGDVVRVQGGSTPPADGTIVSGESTFDESSLTGESRPIKKVVGDQVFLGTINNSQVVDVRVDAIGGETMLDQVVRVVRDGQTKRAPIERLADILTGYFVPLVTLFAISTWVIWLALGVSGTLPRDYLDKDVGGWPVWSLEFAIAVFVVACPCGIGLAAPTALLVGSGLAAKYGILARGGGEAFQEAAQLDTIIFDKTGTLTQGGEPRVTDAEHLTEGASLSKEVVLGIAAEVESASTHPLAIAIRHYCDENGAIPSLGSAFEETPGRGLKAFFEARKCTAIIGNEKWMEEHAVGLRGETARRLESWKAQGKSIVLLALRNEGTDVDARAGAQPFVLAAAFAISDPLRPNAAAVIARLQSQGLATWMISGDNQTTAKAVAKMVGIPESNVIAGVLPHEKAQKVRWLQESGPKKRLSKWHGVLRKRLNERCIVAMVGDGINDAPALASADVAIAIGSGSNLLTLVDLSRTVFRRVKFNFLWACLYNMAALPIAAGVIYPAGHARLNPVWGSLAMALSSVSVVCSSLALKLYSPPKA
ncbi:hypothetical protein EW146_g1467 [Bondarzewia mesenterica]|uniref:HMA domain-containing protein n=1 Tax=Bondarzewia mesenterica TaxID=1095465 RepID=A0A4S4M492_9AGAM|nr:hypothetical protein EW146_g1467 [Bondarzewia mesenterica]